MESSQPQKRRPRSFDREPEQQKQKQDQSQQVEGEALPTYPRKENSCIDPCPHFECILSKDVCDTNCNRCLDNPCMICKNNYDGECAKSDKPRELKMALLRPDVIAFINNENTNRMGVVTKDVSEEWRYKYAEKLNKIEDKEEKLVRQINQSSVPNSILKFLYRKKINSIKTKKAELEGAIKSQNDIFNFVKEDDE